MVQKHNEWTIMVYMNANHDDLSIAARKNIMEMCSAGCSDSFSVLILLDREASEDDPNPDDDKYAPTIYEINKYTDEIPTGLTKIKKLDQERFENMGDSETLEEFINSCIEYASAERYCLVIWDHGGGVYTEGEKTPVEKAKKFLTNEDGSLPPSMQRENLARTNISQIKRDLESSFLAIPVREQQPKNNIASGPQSGDPIQEKEEPQPNFLFVSEINECLLRVKMRNNWRNNLDILIFDSCFMQMFENAYSLKESVNCLIASENTFSAEGMGYSTMLEYLKKKSNVDADDLAKTIVTGSFIKLLWNVDATISCLKLAHVDAMSELIDDLAKLFIDFEDQGELYKLIRIARFFCLNFYDISDPFGFGPPVVDFLYFLKKLQSLLVAEEEPTYIDIQNTIKEIIAQSESNLILIRAHGTRVSLQDDTIKTWGAHGFSIFFPEDPFVWDEWKSFAGWYFDDIHQPPFAKTNWKEFLVNYQLWLRSKLPIDQTAIPVVGPIE